MERPRAALMFKLTISCGLQIVVAGVDDYRKEAFAGFLTCCCLFFAVDIARGEHM